MLSGKLIYRYADGEDLILAGETFCAPPGHTPLFCAGSEIVEFSPTEELARTRAVISRNRERAGAGS